MVTQIEPYVEKICRKARLASRSFMSLGREKKKKVLIQIAAEMVRQQSVLLRENQKDLAYAKKEKLSAAMMDRLALTDDRIKGMAESVRAVAKLPDPVGNVLSKSKRPNGLEIQKVSVPLGVILIIYEARPNVTSECASLAIKSSNAVILRSGREAFHTSLAAVKIFQKVLKANGLNPDAVQIVETQEHKAVDYLLKQNRYIDLVIPRGGESLIRKVTELSIIPVIKHYKGICHVYVDAVADLNMALSIAENAKCQRPSVCNAMETLLVNQKVAAKFLPAFAGRFATYGGRMYGDQNTRRILGKRSDLFQATEKSYQTEYLDLALSIKVVKDVEEAIAHIARFGSGHTESIITKNKQHAARFMEGVDSASVMVNASTRFADGFEYGLGAEIGISTDKIHARGPMGLDGLTTYKYCVTGKGQIRK